MLTRIPNKVLSYGNRKILHQHLRLRIPHRLLNNLLLQSRVPLKVQSLLPTTLILGVESREDSVVRSVNHRHKEAPMLLRPGQPIALHQSLIAHSPGAVNKRLLIHQLPRLFPSHSPQLILPLQPPVQTWEVSLSVHSLIHLLIQHRLQTTRLQMNRLQECSLVPILNPLQKVSQYLCHSQSLSLADPILQQILRLSTNLILKSLQPLDSLVFKTLLLDNQLHKSHLSLSADPLLKNRNLSIRLHLQQDQSYQLLKPLQDMSYHKVQVFLKVKQKCPARIRKVNNRAY